LSEALDRLVEKLGDGHEVKLEEEVIFQLSSFTGNPVVTPKDIGLVWKEKGEQRQGAVFNGGAILHDGRVFLTPRCHRNYQRFTFFDEKLGIERCGFDNYISEIWVLASQDGVSFKKTGTVIRGDGSEHKDFLYGIEDIRISPWRGGYLLVGCGKIKPPFKGGNADRVAIYSTQDFRSITYHGIITEFDSRNAIPLLTDGQSYIFLRFHPHIYLAPLEAEIDQLLNPSSYTEAWREIYREKDKYLLLKAGRYGHEREKIGPGPPPVRTREGWLLIYHAVGKIGEEVCRAYGLNRPIERGYSVCAALLDPHDPRKVLLRTRSPLYIPHKPYELEGNQQYPIDIPAVVFPTGAILHRGKLLLYCGAGDKYVILLSCNIDKLLDHLHEHGEQPKET